MTPVATVGRHRHGVEGAATASLARLSMLPASRSAGRCATLPSAHGCEAP